MSLPAELKPISHATSTKAACKPTDASAENQTERYKLMPSKVVYHETNESRQLAMKRALTIGRVRPVRSEEVLEDTYGTLVLSWNCYADAARQVPEIVAAFTLFLFFFFAGLGGLGGGDDLIGLQRGNVIVVRKFHLE